MTPAAGRSEAIIKAHEFGAEELMFIDADMEFGPDYYWKLRKVPGDIVSGLFWSRRVPSGPCIFNRVERDGAAFLQPVLPEKQQEVDAVGMAATIIRKPVIEWANKPSENGAVQAAFMDFGRTSEDLSFCLRARQEGFKIVCEPSLKVAHWGAVAFNGTPILSDVRLKELSAPFGGAEKARLWELHKSN